MYVYKKVPCGVNCKDQVYVVQDKNLFCGVDATGPLARPIIADLGQGEKSGVGSGLPHAHICCFHDAHRVQSSTGFDRVATLRR